MAQYASQIFFFFCRKGKHEFYNVYIMALEHVRCLLLEESRDKCEIMCDKVAKC
jgi:hypothetical protein